MASKSEGEVKEAVETIAEAAGEAVATEAALEAAQEAQEDAEELAEEIAAAAMEAARMEEINRIKAEVETWRNDLTGQVGNLSQQVATLSTQLTEALTAMVATPKITVATEAPAMTDQSLIPALSPEPEAPQTVVTVEPKSEGAGARVVPAAPAKRGVRFL